MGRPRVHLGRSIRSAGGALVRRAGELQAGCGCSHCALLALARTGSTSARSRASFRRRVSWTRTVACASPAGKALGHAVRCAACACSLVDTRSQPPHRVRRDASLDQRAVRVRAGASRAYGCSARAGAALTRQCIDGGSPRRGEGLGRLLRLPGASPGVPHCSACCSHACARRSWLWRWAEASDATPLDAFSSARSAWSSPARWRSVVTLHLHGCAAMPPRLARRRLSQPNLTRLP